jgi:hypothetical protein
LYWLQNNLTRDDGAGRSYPELMLRADAMGTGEGLSNYPYIRESMRIVARATVLEQDVVEKLQQAPRARWFGDSIGIGCYMVDIHPCGANERGEMSMPHPFQIPMAALLPRGDRELPSGGKESRLRGDSDFAIEGTYPLSGPGLAAASDAPLTRAEAAVALEAYFGKRLAPDAAVAESIERGWMATDHRNWFHPDLPFYWTDWREAKLPKALPPLHATRTGPVRRRELAERLTDTPN